MHGGHAGRARWSAKRAPYWVPITCAAAIPALPRRYPALALVPSAPRDMAREAAAARRVVPLRPSPPGQRQGGVACWSTLDSWSAWAEFCPVFTLELVPPDRPPASNRVASHRARNVWARSLLLSAPPPRAKCTVDLQGREAGQARGASNSKCDKTTLHGCNIILVNTQAPREEVAPEPNQA